MDYEFKRAGDKVVGWSMPEPGTHDPLGKKVSVFYGDDRFEVTPTYSNGSVVMPNAVLGGLVNEVGMARKTIAKLEAEIAELKEGFYQSREIINLRKEVESLRAERDSACASFSEALAQARKAEDELKRKAPTQIQVYKLANAALELAQYASNLEDHGGGAEGVYILKVRELVKGMV